MDSATLLQTLLLTPLVAAIISASFFRRSRWGAPIVSVTAAGVILILSLQLLLGLDPANPTATASFPGFTVGSFKELETWGVVGFLQCLLVVFKANILSIALNV